MLILTRFFPHSLQCLFCEKTFKDRQTLKDHMRKKQHRKINPKNKEFDKYYLINYLVSKQFFKSKFMLIV